jgi:hypothetical protein
MKKNPPTLPFDIKNKKITYVTSSLGTIDSSLIRYFIGTPLTHKNIEKTYRQSLPGGLKDPDQRRLPKPN